MAAFFPERTKCQTSTTGTGTISLGSAATGFRSFDQAVTDGNLVSGGQVYYCIESGNGTDWETGLGTFTSGSPSTLTRSVAESSNGGTAISLTGTSTVFATLTGASVVTSYLTAGTIGSGVTGSTAAQDTSTTALATTAFVTNQASSTTPVMDGTATVGTSKRYARADHIHPSDTTLLAVAGNLSDVASAGVARQNIERGIVTLTSGATVNTDCSQGVVFKLVLGTNCTLANPTNLQAGARYNWIVQQDATGSRTMAFGTAWKWANTSAPSLSTAANATDVITAISDGTNLFAVMSNTFG